MQNFRALGLRPQTPVPPAAGVFAPKPPASGSWGLRPQTPIANFWLRAWLLLSQDKSSLGTQLTLQASNHLVDALKREIM